MELANLATHDIVISEGSTFDFMLTLLDAYNNVVILPEGTLVFMKIKLMNKIETYEGFYDRNVTDPQNVISSFKFALSRDITYASSHGKYFVEYAMPTTPTEPDTTEYTTHKFIRGDVVIESEF